MTHRTVHRSLGQALRAGPARVRRAAAALLLVGAAAPALGAQILRVPEREAASRKPIYVAASIGFLQTQSRFDGQSGVGWRLGEAISYRVAVDYGIRAGAIGVAASLASVPIQRSGIPGSDGDIQLRQYLATFRTPEAEGFFQVIELGAGMAQWASYSGTDVLTPDEREPRNALALVLGYGFGFKVGRKAAITLVQDFGTLIGSSDGLPAGERRSVQQSTTRLGLRMRF